MLRSVRVSVPTATVSVAHLQRAARWLQRHWFMGLPFSILLLLVIAGVFAPLIAPHAPKKGDLNDRNIPPSWAGQEVEQRTVVEQKVTILGESAPREELTQSASDIKLEISDIKAKNLTFAGKILDLSGRPLNKDEIVPGVKVLEVVRPAGRTRFLLGTDTQGRDILSRLIWGARVSMVVAAVTLIIGATLGTAFGLVSGYYGGWVDEIIMRLVDIILALPLMLVAMVLVVVVGELHIPYVPQKEVHLLCMVLSGFIWVRFARQVRAEVLYLKNLDYIALARVSGSSTIRILAVHLLPGVVNTVIVLASLHVSVVILLEAALSFLGAGVPPPTPGLGLDGIGWQKRDIYRLVGKHLARPGPHAGCALRQSGGRLAARCPGPPAKTRGLGAYTSRTPSAV